MTSEEQEQNGGVRGAINDLLGRGDRHTDPDGQGEHVDPQLVEPPFTEPSPTDPRFDAQQFADRQFAGHQAVHGQSAGDESAGDGMTGVVDAGDMEPRANNGLGSDHAAVEGSLGQREEVDLFDGSPGAAAGDVDSSTRPATGNRTVPPPGTVSGGLADDHAEGDPHGSSTHLAAGRDRDVAAAGAADGVTDEPTTTGPTAGVPTATDPATTGRPADSASGATPETTSMSDPVAAEAAAPVGQHPGGPTAEAGLERLVSGERATSYGSRWDQVKGAFVDEPRRAVADADTLVGELLDELQTLFTDQRRHLEEGLDSDGSTTEDLRLALRRYRSFFDRLLSI